jgi:hypothetical protein
VKAEVIFTTIHGSHLYGLAGPNSDLDTFTVTTSQHGARQKVKGADDSVTVGWDAFLAYAFSGSHQSVEALFSPYKVWHSHPELAVMLDSYRITGRDVLEKYERTIRAFAHADDYKRRRHACRLWLNVQQLRWWGRFNPRMTPAEVAWANDLATSDTDRDELSLLLTNGEGALGIDFLDVGRY